MYKQRKRLRRFPKEAEMGFAHCSGGAWGSSMGFSPAVPHLNGSRWVLVCPLVFKTCAGGQKLPRWVRFPHIPAKNIMRIAI